MTKAIGGLFGGGGGPQAQPVPVNPADDSAKIKARQDAEVAAIADAKSRGRGSTVAAGGESAAMSQYERGLLKKSRRSAVASEVLG